MPIENCTLEGIGSSPLARGLRGRRARRRPHLGIIPARAGFTTSSVGFLGGKTDHPRSRGVYGEYRPQAGISAGSSPLARGLHEGGAQVGLGGWIIPARAGFTVRFLRRSCSLPDHPRSRGVYGGSMAVTRPPTGSSPLARGLPCRTPQHYSTPRIIPARAGFTSILYAPYWRH